MKKATAAEREEFLTEHLPYEVGMLRHSFRLLREPSDELTDNMRIECFCLHVRNLIEFFENGKHCHFDPRWFTHFQSDRG